MTSVQTSTVDRLAVEDFLVHEADLLDHSRFEDWHQLFTADGCYFIPSSEHEDPTHQGFFVNDDPLRLEERVYHISRVPFPSQSPPSRTLHFVSNVRVRPDETAADRIAVLSNQVIAEMRLGDFRQVGLGEQRVFAAEVEHRLEVSGEGGFRIARKTVRLLNRGAPMSNLTFLL
jgi:3-phenylpropionate/cinnamic acid dioxygenase small subunit